MPIYYMVGNFASIMSTRDEIIRIGDELIRDKGYNAFSFYTISKEMGIKNASIHYHFPTKTALAVAIINLHKQKLENLMTETAHKDPLSQLKAYLSTYSLNKADNKVCIVGSLATDIGTVEEEIQVHLKSLVEEILNWVTGILKEGRDKGLFKFDTTPRNKALLVITSMLASLQLTRFTDERDFNTIKDTIIKELKA